MESFPAFIPLRGKRVIVIGEGEAAAAKARLFAGAPCELVHLTEAQAMGCERLAAAIVFVAVEDEATASTLAAKARRGGAMVNCVDRPELCDFYTPALIDRGLVVGAVGASGAAPTLAAKLRQEIETLWPVGLGEVARLLASARDRIRSRFPDPKARRAFLNSALTSEAAALAMAGEMAAAIARLDALADGVDAAKIGSGGRLEIAATRPRDGLTLGELRLMAEADLVVAGPNVSSDLLALVRRDAQRLAALSEPEVARRQGLGETIIIFV